MYGRPDGVIRLTSVVARLIRTSVRQGQRRIQSHIRLKEYDTSTNNIITSKCCPDTSELWEDVLTDTLPKSRLADPESGS